MTDYQKQAKDFLKACNAKMSIEFQCVDVNQNWHDDSKRNKYRFTITTQRGIMSGDFWNSIYNTEKKIKPTEYDILACLTHYDPGTMNDFFSEMGFKIYNADDMFAFMNTYNAVVKEYRDLCRIFTEEQMEMLREIQ